MIKIGTITATFPTPNPNPPPTHSPLPPSLLPVSRLHVSLLFFPVSGAFEGLGPSCDAVIDFFAGEGGVEGAVYLPVGLDIRGAVPVADGQAGYVGCGQRGG